MIDAATWSGRIGRNNQQRRRSSLKTPQPERGPAILQGVRIWQNKQARVTVAQDSGRITG